MCEAQSYSTLTASPSFEDIVREHHPLVFRTLLRLTESREHVDDLAQEVFLRLYRALPSFRGEALVSTYLYRIAVNVAQDEWKRQRREDRRNTSLSDDVAGWQDRLQHASPNPEQELQQAQLQQAVDTELAKLSNVERAILVLYHQEERSYQQIAESLSMPIGTVRTHLFRGRNKLRAALKTGGRHDA